MLAYRGCCKNYHKVCGLRQQKLILLILLGSRSLKSVSLGGCQSGAGRHMLPSDSKGESTLCFFQLLVAAGIPWLAAAPHLCFCLHIAFSPLNVKSLSVSLLKCARGCNRASQDDLFSISRSSTESYLQSAFFLLNKTTFTVSGIRILYCWGPIF